MAWFRKSKHEKFIEENADSLVRNLAHYCAAGAKDVIDTLGECCPQNVGPDIVFLFLLSFRGTIEARGLNEKFGNIAHRRILRAIDKLYEETFPEVYADTGPFSKSLLRDAEVSISKSPDPREWIRIHAIRTLQTKDPDHEFFHLTLAKALMHGQPMGAVIERAS